MCSRAGLQLRKNKSEKSTNLADGHGQMPSSIPKRKALQQLWAWVESLESRFMKKTLEYCWQQCAFKARAASGILNQFSYSTEVVQSLSLGVFQEKNSKQSTLISYLTTLNTRLDYRCPQVSFHLNHPLISRFTEKSSHVKTWKTERDK